MNDNLDLTRLAAEEERNGRLSEKNAFLLSMTGGLAVILVILYFSLTMAGRVLTWTLVMLVLAAFCLFLSYQARRFYRLALARAHRLREALAESQRHEQERCQAEARLSETEARLRQAAKMEAVGRLAGGVAHDFNNLLTAILGYSDLAAYKLGPANPVSGYLAEINRAAEQAAGLTSQLLAFSRKQILKPQVLRLDEVVNEVEKLLSRLIREDIELVIYHQPDLGLTIADPGQLQQVILNLALNARDAMPGGGRIIIETANATLAEEYAALRTDMLPGEYVQLTVSDTGCGMDAATLQKIFEPFFTTKESGQGTGLGLAMVYGIVQQSGGFINVYSEPGQGACFKIYLPRRSAPSLTESSIKPALPDPVTSGTENILLVEDEPGVRSLAEHILRGRGYNVTTAAEGKAALSLLPQLATPPDLLITDVIMPGMNGRDLAVHLQAAQPGLKVLYLSGYTDHVVVDQGILEPGLAFLQKPFTPDQLAAQVRATLAAHLN